ncbi:MAG: adenine phosphoribosyltransferase [Candidatus Krumholzibacteria bacterium]|nr:adenine phosphoribosyltransferase [Candidatus Krumholzibacteria bacterium]
MSESLKSFIRAIPDFPKSGIMFRDITPALLEPRAFKEICDELYKHCKAMTVDKIAAVESRGFIFASVLAYKMEIGFIPMRKPGKLPWNTIKEKYSLEYGEAAIEMHTDAISKGDRILILDDLLATGGTAAAAARLIERQGGIVEELAFLIELTDLGGRNVLGGRKVYSLMKF